MKCHERPLQSEGWRGVGFCTLGMEGKGRGRKDYPVIELVEIKIHKPGNIGILLDQRF